MFAVTILGNNSAIPMHDRHPTAQVVTFEEMGFLIDCGEGTQIQMNKYKIRRNRIDHIFISHLHGDHYFGLPGLLNSYSLTGRTEDLHLYAPPDLEIVLHKIFEISDTELSYTLHFHPLLQTGVLVDEKKLQVECFEVAHRIPCWGFLFREKPKPRKILAEIAKEKSIPASFYGQLKQGADYKRADGVLIKNSEVTTDPTPQRSYAYCADTIYLPALSKIIDQVNLLYHETTYLNDLKEKAEARYHSTSEQAANLALDANVQRLIVGHFSSKYSDLDPFLDETRRIFPNTDLALEGVTYLIQTKK
ncbi:MAG: ribonuclease Z [Chitinophagaceae bacterium]